MCNGTLRAEVFVCATRTGDINIAVWEGNLADRFVLSAFPSDTPPSEVAYYRDSANSYFIRRSRQPAAPPSSLRASRRVCHAAGGDGRGTRADQAGSQSGRRRSDRPALQLLGDVEQRRREHISPGSPWRRLLDGDADRSHTQLDGGLDVVDFGIAHHDDFGRAAIDCAHGDIE